jgi:hypothetical protein
VLPKRIEKSVSSMGDTSTILDLALPKLATVRPVVVLRDQSWTEPIHTEATHCVSANRLQLPTTRSPTSGSDGTVPYHFCDIRTFPIQIVRKNLNPVICWECSAGTTHQQPMSTVDDLNLAQ